MTLLEDNDQTTDPVEYVRKKFNMAADVHIDPVIAKSKLESDNYIKMMEKQKDELAESYLKLKADYESRAKLEELIDQIPSRDSANNLNANNTKAQQDPIDIDKLVDAKFSSYEKKKKADENLKIVKDQLREKLGNNYANTLRNKMDELDLSEAELDALAARSPKAFMKTIGLDETPNKNPFQSPMSSSYKSDNFKKTEENRNWDYYQKLKETNPRAWLDPKVQTQMYHDAQRLGPAFATEDFNKYSERLPQQ